MFTAAFRFKHQNNLAAMVKRVRANVEATNKMRRHLQAVEKLMVVDTTGYQNDPYKLLRKGVLMVEEDVDEEDDAPEEEDTELSVSAFLKSELPERRRHVVNSIRTQFSSRLMSRKMEILRQQNKGPRLHLCLGRPRIQYVESDRPLMNQIFTDMQDLIDAAVVRAVKKAQEVLTDLGPELGLVF
jgi:hypothetical protein